MSLQFPLQFKRQYSGPLDVDDVFSGISELNTYLTTSLPYAGQIIGLTDGRAFIITGSVGSFNYSEINVTGYTKTSNFIGSGDTQVSVSGDSVIIYSSGGTSGDFVESSEFNSHTGDTTNPHSVTAEQTNAVPISGDSTIYNVKTFNVSPKVPTPTNGDDVTNKDYVDNVAQTSGLNPVAAALIFG